MEPETLTINDAYLALKEWNPQMSVRDFHFTFSTFWVQIHGLPLQFLNKENILKIWGLFKDVLCCDGAFKKSLLGMKFLRIQVEVDLTKLLLIGHLQKSCKIQNSTSREDGTFDVWLRAETSSSIVVSEGHYLCRIENPRHDYFDSFSEDDLVLEERWMTTTRLLEELQMTTNPLGGKATVSANRKDGSDRFPRARAHAIPVSEALGVKAIKRNIGTSKGEIADLGEHLDRTRREERSPSDTNVAIFRFGTTQATVTKETRLAQETPENGARVRGIEWTTRDETEPLVSRSETSRALESITSENQPLRIASSMVSLTSMKISTSTGRQSSKTS
ncbi:hypothetical protein FEM48_Zijuj11G0106800 [Ziziphus jujuba var. spinosa]|uniref:DUF4283 domain-containing protein n=1 Tax=Ziziphus jujuba var. spinosa TaxID=714518 RepID=A0A978UIH1_ZIZJJ|nr:hypothetical protein FEM48_Zijuj11G0106800 [Ziziphus jujuba var. spinosa]